MARQVKRFARRETLKWMGVGAALPLLNACQGPPPTPQVVTKEVVVEKPVERVVTQVVERQVTAVVERQVTSVVVVTPTPVPAPARTTPLQRVRIGVGNQVNNLDYLKSALVVYEFDTNVLTSGQLYRLDSKQKPYPELVDRSETSADGLTVTMTLKPNLVYSDGTPVKAGDALVAWTRLNKMEGAQFFSPVESLTAPNDSTLVWKLKTPYPALSHVLGYQYLIMHPGERVLNDSTYWTRPVSAGPYMIGQWKPGTDSIVLQANPKYVFGPVMAQEIELVNVPDLTSRVLQLATGALDFAFELPYSAAANLGKETRAIPHPQGGMFHVTINTAKAGPLADPKVRQAMSLAIDRDAVSQKAFSGVSAPARAVMYQGVPEWGATLPNGGKQDLEGAKKLLAETPYASGFEFNMLTFSSRAGWPQATLLVAEDWKKIGVIAKVQPVEDAILNTRAAAGDIEVIWTGTVQGPINMMKIMYTAGATWNTAAHYSNNTVTDLLNKAQVEPDDAKRLGMVQQVEKIVLQDMPHIPICERALLLGSRVRDDVVGVVARQNLIYVKTVAEMKG